MDGPQEFQSIKWYLITITSLAKQDKNVVFSVRTSDKKKKKKVDIFPFNSFGI